MPINLTALTASPEYNALIAKRNRLIWPLLILTIAAYIAFILAVAFAPAALGKPIMEGSVISVGILFGLGLIIFNFVITLIYVRGANRDIEPLIARVQQLAGEK